MNMTFSENLAKRPKAVLTQSSTYDSQGPGLANDGNNQTTYGQCSHTATKQSLAWFQVDLKEERSIKNVKIYYREEGIQFDQRLPHRLLSFLT